VLDFLTDHWFILFLFCKEVLESDFGGKIERLEVGRLVHVLKPPLKLLVLVGTSNFIIVFFVDLLNKDENLISRWSLVTKVRNHIR
jgi:hypothetical protein